MQADMPGWSVCLGGVMARRQGRCHIVTGKGRGGRREPVNLEVWPNIQGTGHIKAVSLSNEKA